MPLQNPQPHSILRNYGNPGRQQTGPEPVSFSAADLTKVNLNLPNPWQFIVYCVREIRSSRYNRSSGRAVTPLHHAWNWNRNRI